MEWLKYLAIRKLDGVLVNNWYQGKVYCKASPIHLLDENNYLDNQLHGIQYSWYFDGAMRYKDNYAYGEKYGTQYEYSRDGAVIYKENYINNLKHGLQYTYSTFSNKPKQIREFYHGNLIRTRLL
jgi:antitoxin component YwqK of YwqJK toxin-antitoxin module